MRSNKNWTKLANLDLSLWCRCRNLASSCNLHFKAGVCRKCPPRATPPSCRTFVTVFCDFVTLCVLCSW